jgi:hypothetical protein
MAIIGGNFLKNTGEFYGIFLELFLAVDGMKFSALRWVAAHGFLFSGGTHKGFRLDNRRRRTPGIRRACRR